MSKVQLLFYGKGKEIKFSLCFIKYHALMTYVFLCSKHQIMKTYLCA
jgi:hypothetical protein